MPLPVPLIHKHTPPSILRNLNPNPSIPIRPPHPLPAFKPLQLPDLSLLFRLLQRLFARQPRRLAVRCTDCYDDALFANRAFA